MNIFCNYHYFLGYCSNIIQDFNRQNELFITEQRRQKAMVGRVEKIEITYEGPPGKEILVMNKNLSTPYDCAKR